MRLDVDEDVQVIEKDTECIEQAEPEAQKTRPIVIGGTLGHGYGWSSHKATLVDHLRRV
jgi:hypothetical protein